MKINELPTPCYVIDEKKASEESGNLKESLGWHRLQDPPSPEGILELLRVPADRAVSGRNHSQRSFRGKAWI